MKKENDNEERLIETIVTIGTLIIFGLLMMYSMRGCSSEEMSNNANLTTLPPTVAVPVEATALVEDKSINGIVGLVVDKNSTDDNLTVMDVDINRTLDENIKADKETHPIVNDVKLRSHRDENISDDINKSVQTIDENRSVEKNETADLDTNVTVNGVDVNKSVEVDKNITDKNTSLTVDTRSEKNEEEGIIADINSNAISSKPYILKGIYFRSGSSILTNKSKRQLDAIAKSLKSHNEVKVMIRGHTDSKGSEKKNQKLSLKRANATGRALVERGVNIDNIWIDGMGETEPITKNGTAKEMLLNRRVDIAVTK